MYKQIKILTPSVPNFILTEYLKQPITLADFTDEELKQIGESWTQELISKARGRRTPNPMIFKTTNDRPINHERE